MGCLGGSGFEPQILTGAIAKMALERSNAREFYPSLAGSYVVDCDHG